MTFPEKFITKLKQQVRSRRVGFLLGAGSSYLDGSGYPLATELWNVVKSSLSPGDQNLIQEQIDRDSIGLEEALDRLDDGTSAGSDLRHRVASVIAQRFRTITAPIDHHRLFVRGLCKRRERRVPLFNLNYDPLVERASDEEGLLLTDGFLGISNTFFIAQSFEYRLGLPGLRRGKACIDSLKGIINLYKLHGSINWFVDANGRLRRSRFEDNTPTDARLLMIPPHYRKGQDTGFQPFASIWSEFRALLTNDRNRLLNRLFCVGYGMRDTHVNPILEAASGRSDFTLIILARSLRDQEFNDWKNRQNIIVATETRCALYGEEGPGIPEVWSFEWLAKEVNNG